MVLYNGRLSGLLYDLKQRGEVGTVGCDVVHDPCHRVPLALHYNMLDTRLMTACREGEERGEGWEGRRGGVGRERSGGEGEERGRGRE